MRYIVENIDNLEQPIESDAELIDFVRRVAIENDDIDIIIVGIYDAKVYLSEFCPNLKLTEL